MHDIQLLTTNMNDCHVSSILMAYKNVIFTLQINIFGRAITIRCLYHSSAAQRETDWKPCLEKPFAVMPTSSMGSTVLGFTMAITDTWQLFRCKTGSFSSDFRNERPLDTRLHATGYHMNLICNFYILQSKQFSHI